MKLPPASRTRSDFVPSVSFEIEGSLCGLAASVSGRVGQQVNCTLPIKRENASHHSITPPSPVCYPSVGILDSASSFVGQRVVIVLIRV